MITACFLETRLDVGGSEMMWAALLRGLDRQRVRPLLCCLYEAGPLARQLAQEGVPLVEALARGRADWRVAPRLVDVLRRERVDVLVLINQPMVQWWGAWCGRRAGVRAIVLTAHSWGTIKRRLRMRWVRRWTLSQIDAITAVSPAHRAALVEDGLPAERISVVPYGIDVPPVPSAATLQALRAALGLAADGPVAAIVGRLRPEKAQEIFLRAAALALVELPSARFLVIGDGPERGRLESLARELRLGKAVQFLGLRQDVWPLLHLCRLTALSSRSEVLPVAALESLAAGVPVVATRVGSLPDLIEEGRTGFLVEVDDARALAGRLAALLRDASLAAALGAQGRALVRQSYTVERMAAQTVALFDRLLTGTQG